MFHFSVGFENILYVLDTWIFGADGQSLDSKEATNTNKNVQQGPMVIHSHHGSGRSGVFFVKVDDHRWTHLSCLS